ncbi:MAG: hypothetical protein KF857_06455 [Fimbriimonadaceae bacterium]|nr:hypothetical protein [Fimbriimonadaceae bacterium]
MFVVVSKWEFDPMVEEATLATAGQMMAVIGSWDGVEEAYNIRTGPGHVLAVIKYRDEATYDRLVRAADNPFDKLAAEHGFDNGATWLWSERGHVVR